MNSTTQKTTTSTNQNNNPNEPRQSLGLKPTFKFLYEFLGKVFSTQTKCKAYEMEPHESEALAQQSDDLIVEFFPSVQSRWVKLIVFIGSLLGIFGKKYLSHLEQMEKDKPQISLPPKENEVKSDSPKVMELGGNFPVNSNKRF